ncbi:GNAT family N-acetyltransferase [Jeotgalibacillus sp. ET6]|uniref:GNAT family N-acetyltransferase n=1 Tax=Jeotgalibacillus sp. ET6 TaxID=3037260 RepID=UPI00241866BB|nr:GNAT family N-acetyltransferase [Jeotgalibacillus sp. ET6]MDG5472804.1 GNAT family N-acetyltransferase [Jeotgalibacillus sp. ET6]
MGSFIAGLNKNPEQHTGYFGTEAKEVIDTLKTDFSDLACKDSFAVLKENGKIIAALGADWDQDSATGELWGPYSLASGEQWQKDASRLWRILQHKINQNGTWHGFYNVQNQQAIQWISLLGGKLKSREVILQVLPEELKPSEKESVEEFTELYTEEFKSLHLKVFPDSYFSSGDILSRKNDRNRLFVIEKNQRLAGYVYVEANPSHNEGSIEYIAVNPEFRGMGMGEALLKRAAAFLFQDMNAKEISICVNAGNEAAIHLYKKVGFSEKHRLEFYNF